MANNIFNDNNCVVDNDLETEDGEIDDRSSAENKRKDDEIENYYLSLNALGCDLRCSCCGDVYSDPVKLKCQHLIDRSCAVIKKNGNVIECYLCHFQTICEDVDQLVTDFDVASRIPPKPESFIAIINKHKGQLLNCDQEMKVNGNDRETIMSRKRKRKTRWDKIDNVPQTFTGAIKDILSCHNLPKNITMSQFKKFTEISSKSSVMSLLTKAVLQSVNVEVQMRNANKSGSYSDSEILEMIPAHELEDLFELEKIQYIMLYRDALDKGVLLPPSITKYSKLPLLPTPKPSSNDSNKSKNGSSPKSQKKISTSDSSDSEISDKSSVNSMDVSIKCPISDLSDLNLKSNDVNESLTTTIEGSKEKTDIVLQENTNPKDSNDHKTVLEINNSKEDPNESLHMSNNLPENSHSAEDSTTYRDSVNRLHSIYSSMYQASLKMKELENQLQTPDYQSAYKTYSENYNEYQTLYSSLQTAISIDSVVTEKSDSLSVGNSSDNKQAIVLRHTRIKLLSQNSSDNIATDTVNNGHQRPKSLSVVNSQRKPSSTNSPLGCVPDSNDSHDNNQRNVISHLIHKNSLNITPMSNDTKQYKPHIAMNNKTKFGYLWISNLCKETRTTDLCTIFSKFGHVSKIKLFQYKAHSPMSFFSLVFMPNFKEAEAAYRELQNTTLLDRSITIKMLCPPVD